MRSISPLPRRSSVTKAMPASRAALIEFELHRAAVDRDLALPAAGQAGAVERAQQFGPPGAHDAGQPDDLARHARRARCFSGACQPALSRARLKLASRRLQQRLAGRPRARAG